jgi:hypothetical protein
LNATPCGSVAVAGSDEMRAVAGVRLRSMRIGAPESKTPELGISSGGCGDISLTMSYFHTGIRTIIGAEAFHCPVRDGKEWDHLAMVIRLNWLPGRWEAAKPIR